MRSRPNPTLILAALPLACSLSLPGPRGGLGGADGGVGMTGTGGEAGAGSGAGGAAGTGTGAGGAAPIGPACAAGLAACNGDTLTTCNAQGTGYQPGGAACAPLRCSSGACRAPLFIEDFEDGDAVGWSPQSGTGIGSSAVTNTNAHGGTYAFRESGATVYRTITPAAQPTAISAWVRPSDTQSGTIDFTGLATVSLGAPVAFGPGSFTLVAYPTVAKVGYQVDVWNHIELRNIDWTTWTFDFAVNDVVVATRIPALLTPIGSITIKATGAIAWDDIAFFRTDACVPNRAVCQGDTALVCNADGSGTLGGGTTCPAGRCFGGRCVTAFLEESFEDGVANDWVPNSGGTATTTVVASTGASGTGHSLEVTGGSYYGGPYYPLPNVQPRHIGFWMSGVGGELVPSTNTRAGGELIRIIGQDQFPADGTAVGVQTADMAWHHVELRNIDWTARTFDLYVDDALKAAYPFPANAGNGIVRIDIFNTSSGVPPSSTRWDEIDVSP